MMMRLWHGLYSLLKGLKALALGFQRVTDQTLVVKKYYVDWDKSTKPRQYMKNKLVYCMGTLLLVFLVLSFIVVYGTLHNVNNSIKNINNNYNYSVTEILAPRGDILDSNGDIMATSIPNYILVLEPNTIMERSYYEIPMMMVFKNILHMDENAMHQEIKEIYDLKQKKNAGQLLSDEELEKAKKNLYLRYAADKSQGKTYLSLAQVEKIRQLKADLSSGSNSTRKKAVCELYQVTSEEIDKIVKDYQEQAGGGRNFIQKILDKFSGYKVQIDYAKIAAKYGMTEDEIRGIVSWKAQRIVGIQFEAEYERVYPNATLACKILGFYSQYNPESSMGLEKYYNLELTGVNGVRQGYLTGEYNMEYYNQDAIKGNTIVTTVDNRMQAIVEEQIKRFMEEIGAENVGVICMDPNTGSIRAMADQRVYNPNKPTDLESYYSEEELNELWEKIKTANPKLGVQYLLEEPKVAEQLKASAMLNMVYRNFCISDTYEPGSTFKPLTIAMAYEEGLVNAETDFVCDGSEKVANYVINCHNREGCGWLDLTGALRNSCNDFLMHIVSMVGRERFYDYRCRFGIGYRTGIDLPSEASASTLNYSLEQLNVVELATSSFGQGFNVTMLQMAASGCALINGGYLYTPHLVQEIRSADNAIISKPHSEPVTQIISGSTSDYLRGALYQTVENGTASYVKISGYEIGGKTGTAQKNDRDSGNYVISLESFAPVEKPQLYIYVVIDQPHLEDQDSSKWAQLLSKRIWMEILPYMNILSGNDGIDYIDPGESGDDPDIPNDGYEQGGYIEQAALLPREDEQNGIRE